MLKVPDHYGDNKPLTSVITSTSQDGGDSSRNNQTGRTHLSRFHAAVRKPRGTIAGAANQAEKEQPDAEVPKLQRDFDDAAVRDALTQAHELAAGLEQELDALTGPELDRIDGTISTFLEENKRGLGGKLVSSRQKSMFETGFDSFGTGLAAKGEAIKQGKISQYRQQVYERQNAAFLQQALEPGVLTDDEAQSGLRTMYLYNVEALHDDLPEPERRAKRDAADREFCKQVLDKRLATNPASLATMLDAMAVRRVLGEEEVAGYQTKAAEAEQVDRIRSTATDWAKSAIPPEEAEKKAVADFGADQSTAAMEAYWRERERNDRETAMRHLEQFDAAVRESGAAESGSASLDRLLRTDPELAARVTESLDKKRRAAGAEPVPDYISLLDKLNNFDPQNESEQLREREQLWKMCDTLGGSGSPAFTTYLRAFLGQPTAEDSQQLEEMRIAAEVAKIATGDAMPTEYGNHYLHQFNRTVRIIKERKGVTELDYMELRQAAEKTLPALGTPLSYPDRAASQPGDTDDVIE